MDLKPYEEIKQEYGKLRRTFNLTEDINIINSEEILFAEQFKQEGLTVFEPIRAHLDDARIKTKISRGKTNKICDSTSMDKHYFALGQFTLPTENHSNKLTEHMNLKPYGEIKHEYEALRRTYNLTADRPYNNTWNFKQTPATKRKASMRKARRINKSYTKNQ